MAKKQIRYMCFTLNNYTQDEWDYLWEEDTDYTILGKEKGKNGTPHIQGYIEFKGSKNWDTIKKKHPRIHIEERRGTPQQAADYCKKDGDYIEKGEISKQGKRTDLDRMANMIVEGQPVSNVAITYPKDFIKFHRGISALHNILKPHRTTKPKCYWFWGDTGTGKTYRAKQLGSTYFIKDNTRWWADYQQEEVIIIDDFRKDDIPLQTLLKWLDENKISVEIKGGYIPLNSPVIAITCDQGPWMYWMNNDLDQLTRRLDGGVCACITQTNEIWKKY